MKLILHQLKRDDVATSQYGNQKNNDVALPTTDSQEDCWNVTSLFCDQTQMPNNDVALPTTDSREDYCNVTSLFCDQTRCDGVILQAKISASLYQKGCPVHNFRVFS
jgi:hypothetical protein